MSVEPDPRLLLAREGLFAIGFQNRPAVGLVAVGPVDLDDDEGPALGQPCLLVVLQLLLEQLHEQLAVTVKSSRTIKAAAAGSVSTGASFLLEQAQGAKDLAGELQDYLTWASWAVVALTVLCFGLVAYYKWQDIKVPKEEQ
jgi:hypothetical protein